MSVSSALQPPPGQTINYVNSPDHGDKLVNTSLATTALAAFFVVARMLVKLGVTHGTGLDDCKCLHMLCGRWQKLISDQTS